MAYEGDTLNIKHFSGILALALALAGLASGVPESSAELAEQPAGICATSRALGDRACDCEPPPGADRAPGTCNTPACNTACTVKTVLTCGELGPGWHECGNGHAPCNGTTTCSGATCCENSDVNCHR